MFVHPLVFGLHSNSPVLSKLHSYCVKTTPSGVLLTLQLCPGCTPDFTGEMLYLILTEYTTLVSSLSAAHPLTTLLHIVVHKTISGKSDRYSGIVISSQATSIYMMVVKM